MQKMNSRCLCTENKPLVSIIVLTYNHEKFIRQALDSIIMQKVCFSYEILVGDDASTDGTQSILKEYKAKYPDLFHIEFRTENLGATRNAYDLLIKARGKYLATLEGDDYWIDPNKLQIQIDFLENNPNFIGCTHECLLVDINGNAMKGKRVSWIKYKKIFTLKDFQGIWMPGQSATFVRRNIFLEPKNDYSIFYKAHKMIGDRTAMLIYLSQGDFYKIDKVMSAYRLVLDKNAKNITSMLYLQSDDWVREEYEFTCKLESYAREELGLNLRFDRRKKDLFLSSILLFIKAPCYRNKTVIFNILRNEKNTLKYILYIPKGIIKKIFNKIHCLFE
jgi:glycosyltransferase involved in cell wall biosynthesis